MPDPKGLNQRGLERGQQPDDSLTEFRSEGDHSPTWKPTGCDILYDNERSKVYKEPSSLRL